MCVCVCVCVCVTGSVFVLTARSCRQASEGSCMVKAEETWFKKRKTINVH